MKGNMKKGATLPPTTQQNMAVRSELFISCLFLKSSFICSLLEVVLRRFSGSEEVVELLFQSIRSSWQGAWCREGGASALTVPGCPGAGQPWVVPGMNTAGGSEMEQKFLLETWYKDLCGDVQASPLPSCSLNLGSPQELKARSFPQKFSSRSRSSGWAVGALLLPLPGLGGMGREGANTSVNTRRSRVWPCRGWRSCHRAGSPAVSCSRRSQSRAGSRDAPGAPKSRSPPAGGHLPMRFPLRIIRISESQTQSCLADSVALLGARACAGREPQVTSGWHRGKARPAPAPAPIPAPAPAPTPFPAPAPPGGAEFQFCPCRSRGRWSPRKLPRMRRAAPAPGGPGAHGWILGMDPEGWIQAWILRDGS